MGICLGPFDPVLAGHIHDQYLECLERRPTFGSDPVKTMNRLLAGIFSLALIGLVIVGPLYLAEKLEQIETSDENIVSIDDIETHNTTSTSYEPYLEFNDATDMPYYHMEETYEPGFFINAEGIRELTSYTFNYNGYWDLAGTDYYYTAQSYLYMFMEVSASNLLIDGADQLTIGVNCNFDYAIHQIYFRGLSATYEPGSQVGINYPSSWGDTTNGLNYYNYTISTTDLNNGASTQSGWDHHCLMVMLRFPSGFPASSTLSVNYQISTEFFEIHNTVWNNQTITTYVPYIQTMTPYNVHKVMMGFGAVLIGVAGWIASPWGEVLDNFLPINSFGKRKRRGKSSRR